MYQQYIHTMHGIYELFYNYKIYESANDRSIDLFIELLTRNENRKKSVNKLNFVIIMGKFIICSINTYLMPYSSS